MSEGWVPTARNSVLNDRLILLDYDPDAGRKRCEGRLHESGRDGQPKKPALEGYMGKRRIVVVLLASLALLSVTAYAADLNDVIGVLPKFAIPMREVGDRFQNMYFAAKGGNWGLAFYMSKYMNNALNPAKLTKPDEYPLWQGFYKDTFDPVNKAIFARDWPTFEKEYTKVIDACNACHQGMGYGFIKVVKQKAPSDQGIDYKVPSKAEDVPK